MLGTVVKNNQLKILARLKGTPFFDFDAVITSGEKARVHLGKSRSPEDVSDSSIDLLMAQSLVLEEVIKQTLDEVARLRNLKSTAPQLRKNYEQEFLSVATRLSRPKRA
jgi:hypothetical protein